MADEQTQQQAVEAMPATGRAPAPATGGEPRTSGDGLGHAAPSTAHDSHAEHDPLAAETLMHHVQDAEYFHLPRVFSPHTDGKFYIPQFRESSEPVVELKTGVATVDRILVPMIEPLNLRITKFMVLEVVAALLLIAVFVPVARRLRAGGAPRGRLTNLLELMVLFIRNQVARPTIGHHDGDRFAPFLLTIFFFVLTCNLLGLVPWAGSPTAALGTTTALALTTFATVIGAGSLKLGPLGFWSGQVPHMDVPWVMGILIKPLIFVIEVFGLGIKHFVLAMRLLANMMAGHMVLSVLMAFIAASAGSLAFVGVVPASLFGSVALSLLELLVAFLQAYIFAFLSGLFIGMAVHPH